MPSRKTRSRKKFARWRFREKVDAAAKSFWFDVEKLRESTSLDTRETVKSLSGGSAKERALYRGAKLWQEQCFLSLKTFFERLQKLAVEYPEQFNNARQRSTWPYSTAVRALQEPFKFSGGDSSIFHAWLTGAVTENPEKDELIYPDWFTSRGLHYKMPSALAQMFRSMEDELKELNRNSLFKDKKSVTTKEELSSPAIDSAPPVAFIERIRPFLNPEYPTPPSISLRQYQEERRKAAEVQKTVDQSEIIQREHEFAELMKFLESNEIPKKPAVAFPARLAADKAATKPEPKEPVKSAKLSYDEDTQVLKYRGKSFEEVNEIQFKAIKALYEADTGLSTKNLMKAIDSHSRLENLFQRKGKPLKKVFIDYDPHSKLWRFKPPRNKPRPS